MGNFSRGFLFIFLVVTVISESLTAELQILPLSPVMTKSIGSNVLVTCRGVGNPSLFSSLQWLDPNNRTIRNDDPLKKDRMSIELMPENTLALIFNSLKEDEAGTYTCTGVYSNTQAVSKSVQIQTIVAITWVDAPEEQFPTVGSDYKIKCRVTANPAPMVDWIRNGSPIPKDERYIVDTDGLFVKNVQESDDGTYICRAIVLDTGELNERNIKLEVQTPPKIDENMISRVEVVDGESANLKCKASGKPPPSYTWIHTSTNKNLESADRFSVNTITGDLTITRVRNEDNGKVQCMASNRAGTVEKEVELVVIVKPQVLDIRNISVASGREAKLECRATGNPLPKVYFWKVGAATKLVTGAQPEDNLIVVETKSDAEKRQSIATLIISTLRKSDDGLYTCIAVNKGGESRKNGHLTVEFPPSFENSPMKEAWSWSRNPVNLTCIAESIPNATIMWRLNGKDIDRNPNFRKEGNGPFSSLLVTPSDPKFYGVYECVAQNIHGKNTHEIVLKEARAPSEILQAKMDVVTATTITFSFIGPSNPGGRPIKAFEVEYKEERQLWSEAKNKTWPFGSPYILENLEPQKTYVFRFAALNEVGLSHWACDQQRTMPKKSSPAEPTILDINRATGYITSRFPDSYELRWSIPSHNGEPIDRYEIKYCAIKKVNDEWSLMEDGCRTIEHRALELTTLKLFNLIPDTYYSIEIRAHNNIGFSTPGETKIRTATGSGNLPHMNDSSHLSSAIIVAIVVAVLLIILVIVDVSCYFVNSTGLLWLVCGKSPSRSSRDDDAKLGSEGKELLNNGNKEGKIQIDSQRPMLDSMKKDTTVEFNLKKSISKTSFVGKDSAV